MLVADGCCGRFKYQAEDAADFMHLDQGNFTSEVDINPDDVFGPAKVLEKEVILTHNM